MKAEYWYAFICFLGGLSSVIAVIRGISRGSTNFLIAPSFYLNRKIRYPWMSYSRRDDPFSFWFIIVLDLIAGFVFLVCAAVFLMVA